MAVNKVILLGRLGSDPELKYSKSNKAFAKVSLATSEKWKDQNGQYQESTEWHRLVFWGKLAETVEKYLRKGSRIYLEGRLKTNKWDTTEGEKRETTEISVMSIDFLDPKPSAEGQTQHPAQDAADDLPF